MEIAERFQIFLNNVAFLSEDLVKIIGVYSTEKYLFNASINLFETDGWLMITLLFIVDNGNMHVSGSSIPL